MIPADVASRLRLVLPDQPAPTTPLPGAQQLADALSELIPGQRVMATIQALLPNGAYRATIAQRDVTLALPFSAKPGDSLELEVVDSGGRPTLALVADRTAAAPPAAAESVPTSLSPTGRLIGDLLGGIGEEGKRAQPAPLNANQALVNAFPADAAELVPVLKDALAQSGMFYESHQAQWVSGTLPKEALLQEPQGRLSPSPEASAARIAPAADEGRGGPGETAPTRGEAAAPLATVAHETPAMAPATAATIPPELTPLVQQQLDALATQNFVWQGQVWPGQQMQWEIEDNPQRERPEEGDEGHQWRTRLRLSLPRLGGIDATLQLRGTGEVELTINTDHEEQRQQLAAAADALGRQLAAAGLRLGAFRVENGDGTR